MPESITANVATRKCARGTCERLLDCTVHHFIFNVLNTAKGQRWIGENGWYLGVILKEPAVITFDHRKIFSVALW